MYYPKSKIKENQYTNGNEYKILSTSTSYKGYYYSTFDGKYFTGKTYSPDAQELKKVSNSSMAHANLSSLTYTKSKGITAYPKLYKPNYAPSVPTDADYAAGYIDRYLIKRVNGGADTIIEVSKDDYNNFTTNILYICLKIRWILSPPLEDQYINGILQKGSVTINSDNLAYSEKYMPGISLYLNDPAQYSKYFLKSS